MSASPRESAVPAIVPPDARHQHLDELEAQLARREADLAALKRDLQLLQARYLDEIGPFYAEFGRLEHELEDVEIQAGLRPPRLDDSDGVDERAESSDTAVSDSRAAPSGDLKKMFRDLAKAIHPDLADDEPARFQRHSLMAEANRAYAERDEDRLRLILRAWERSADGGLDDLADGRTPAERRIAAIDRRLIAIEAEWADLRTSAIARLKARIDEARAQGWDLFNEMVVQVRSDIGRVSRRIAKLRRQVEPQSAD